MNILVLGNGFDLAHELPTKYADFLNFVREILAIIKKDEFDTKEVEIHLDTKSGGILQNIEVNHSEWSALVLNNIWIKYFMKKQSDMKENWIDFELEISKVIQAFDAARKQRVEEMDFKLLQEQCVILHQIIKCRFGNEKSFSDVFHEIYLIDEFILQLEKDLNNLIKALELYLVEFVEKLESNIVSPDIEEVMVRLDKEKRSCDLSKIITFNYTHTFYKLYGYRGNFKYDFIHGEACKNRKLEENNMVLGIDEYLYGEARNKEITFIAFKKFYQRIHKQTGCEYKNWVTLVKEDAEKKPWIYNGKDHSKDYIHNLYIFGHSLDETDGDVLRDLILNDNMMTTIYYKDKEQHGRQIANLVKVIGQDELVKRTGGSTKTIEFKLQQEMVNKKVLEN